MLTYENLIVVIKFYRNQKKKAQRSPAASTEDEKRYATRGRQSPQSKPAPSKPKVAPKHKFISVEDKEVYESYEIMEEDNLYEFVD